MAGVRSSRSHRIHSHEIGTGHFLLAIQSGTLAQRMAHFQGGSSHLSQYVLENPPHTCVLDGDLSKLTAVINHHKESRAMPGSRAQVIGWASVTKTGHMLGRFAGQKVRKESWSDEVLSAHQTPCPFFSLEAIHVAAFPGCHTP